MTLPTDDGFDDTPGHSETIYEVMYQGQPIGRSRLEWQDATMGVAFGAFDPLPAYQTVQSVFLLFAEAEESRMRGASTLAQEQLTTYYQALDALRLTLQTGEGRIVPSSAIGIVDFGEVGREVEVHISDSTFWQARQFS
jgi:hypothetical protein